jgi:GNAT superfamily N-acetyltransferase
MISVIAEHGLSSVEVVIARQAERKLVADADGAGLRFDVSEDFDALLAVNEAARPFACPRLVPWYDHRSEPISGAEGFWIALKAGEDAIGTVACRLRQVKGSLHERLCDLTFLFPDAARRHAWGQVNSPDLRLISGQMMLPGAMWIHPDWRKRGLSQLLFAAAMVVGYVRWKPDHVIGLVEPAKENAIGFDSYGFVRAHKFLVCHVPNEEFTANEERLCVMSMSQQEVRQRFLAGEPL